MENSVSPFCFDVDYVKIRFVGRFDSDSSFFSSLLGVLGFVLPQKLLPLLFVLVLFVFLVSLSLLIPQFNTR